jgi:hypothetical protein
LIWTNFTPCNFDSNIQKFVARENIFPFSLKELNPLLLGGKSKLIPFFL